MCHTIRYRQAHTTPFGFSSPPMLLVALLLGCLARTSLAGGSMPPLNNPCTPGGSQVSLPWCNPALPVDERIKDMLSRMTVAEKIAQLDTQAPAIGSLVL